MGLEKTDKTFLDLETLQHLLTDTVIYTVHSLPSLPLSANRFLCSAGIHCLRSLVLGLAQTNAHTHTHTHTTYWAMLLLQHEKHNGGHHCSIPTRMLVLSEERLRAARQRTAKTGVCETCFIKVLPDLSAACSLHPTCFYHQLGSPGTRTVRVWIWHRPPLLPVETWKQLIVTCNELNWTRREWWKRGFRCSPVPHS